MLLLCSRMFDGNWPCSQADGIWCLHKSSSQFPIVTVTEMSIGWTLGLLIKHANKVPWAFCHCWGGLKYRRTFFSLYTDAGIRAYTLSGKIILLIVFQWACFTQVQHCQGLVPLEAYSWPVGNSRCRVLAYLNLGLRHHSLVVMSDVDSLI